MKLNLFAWLLLVLLCAGKLTAQTQQPDLKKSKTTSMKEFMLLVRVPAGYTNEQAKAVGPQWNAVTDKWKADGIWVTSFVFPGNSFVVEGSDKQVKNEYVLANNLKVVSSIILKAETMEDALLLAKMCPVLNYGGSIEVREIPPR